jgi:hypothetical protein
MHVGLCVEGLSLLVAMIIIQTMLAGPPRLKSAADGHGKGGNPKMHCRTDRTHPYLPSINNFMCLAVAFGLLFVAASAIAEETDKVQELQRVIEVQQQQLEAQQRQLEDQMQMLRRLQSEVERLAKSADGDRATPRESGAPTQSPSESAKPQIPAGEKSALSSADTTKAREAHRRKRTGVAQTDRFDSENPTSPGATYFDPKAVVNIWARERR